MCGDHLPVLLYFRLQVGSPPHVRGPQGVHPDMSKFWGITPACAGTTVCLVLGLLVFRDHPRMCGDHYYNNIACFPSPGSPPHVRGPQFKDIEGNLHEGITPACAGTTGQVALYTHKGGDHPRMCGDHTYQSL